MILQKMEVLEKVFPPQSFLSSEPVLDGIAAIKSSLIVLGVDADDVDQRLATLCAGEKDLTTLSAMSFETWLTLAKNK